MIFTLIIRSPGFEFDFVYIDNPIPSIRREDILPAVQFQETTGEKSCHRTWERLFWDTASCTCAILPVASPERKRSPIRKSPRTTTEF